MTKKQKHKSNKVVKLAEVLKKCQVTDEASVPGKAVLDPIIKPEILAKWPKLKLKVPPIFLHKPIDFEHHVRKVLNMGIRFYQPHRGNNFTKITCESINDHKHLIKYFEKKQLPFHTFGLPSKRKMKVVIRGMPNETALNDIKEALKSVSIPIIRVHKMHTNGERKDNTMLILAVVPYDEEGKNILKVKELLGSPVKLEPPAMKPRQCYRCQKWGHSQRYCHGQIKCVKCGGNHLYKKCERNKDTEPPKCANCNGDHTANYKKCPIALSAVKRMKEEPWTCCFKPLQIVTLDNCNTLYKNEFNKRGLIACAIAI